MRLARLPLLPVAAISLTACGDVDAPDPLIQRCAMYLTMDQETWSGSGSVLDDCGGDDHGTPAVGVTTVPNGSRGRAASFTDRENSCIEVPDSPQLRPTDELTLSAWVMPKGLTGEDDEAFGIISKRAGRDLDDSYNLSLWTGDVAWVELQNAGERFGGKSKLVNDRWTQVTMVYDGKLQPGERVRLFVDGVLDTVGTEGSPTLGSAPIPLRVGCMLGIDSAMMPTKQSFVGLLDDVVVWTRALGDTEVGEWYQRTKQ
jgi:Concanavalin A-like lectin/glucanases superfamily